MIYGFSCMGFLFLLLLMAPQFYWVYLPGWQTYRAGKAWHYGAVERIGLTAMFPLTLIFQNYNFRGWTPWASFLVLAWCLLLLYEYHWIRCLRKRRPPLVLFHIPMTVLSPLAFCLLALYGKSPWLLLAAILYGIGHVGNGKAASKVSCSCPCCSRNPWDL